MDIRYARVDVCVVVHDADIGRAVHTDEGHEKLVRGWGVRSGDRQISAAIWDIGLSLLQ